MVGGGYWDIVWGGVLGHCVNLKNGATDCTSSRDSEFLFVYSFDIYVVITGPSVVCVMCVCVCVCWRLRPLAYICAPLYSVCKNRERHKSGAVQEC